MHTRNLMHIQGMNYLKIPHHVFMHLAKYRMLEIETIGTTGNAKKSRMSRKLQSSGIYNTS